MQVRFTNEDIEKLKIMIIFETDKLTFEEKSEFMFNVFTLYHKILKRNKMTLIEYDYLRIMSKIGIGHFFCRNFRYVFKFVDVDTLDVILPDKLKKVLEYYFSQPNDILHMRKRAPMLTIKRDVIWYNFALNRYQFHHKRYVKNLTAQLKADAIFDFILLKYKEKLRMFPKFSNVHITTAAAKKYIFNMLRIEVYKHKYTDFKQQHGEPHLTEEEEVYFYKNYIPHLKNKEKDHIQLSQI